LARDFKTIRAPLSHFSSVVIADKKGIRLGDSYMEFKFGYLVRCGGMTAIAGGPTLTDNWEEEACRSVVEDWEKTKVKSLVNLQAVKWVNPIKGIDQFMSQVKKFRKEGKKNPAIIKAGDGIYGANESGFYKSLLDSGLIKHDSEGKETRVAGPEGDGYQQMQMLNKRADALLKECRAVRGTDNCEQSVSPWGLFIHQPRKFAVWQQVLYFKKQMDTSVRVFTAEEGLIESLAMTDDPQGRNVICVDPINKYSGFNMKNKIALGVPELFDYYANLNVIVDETKLKDFDFKPKGKVAVSISVPKNDESTHFLAKHLQNGWKVLVGARPHNLRFWLVYGINGGGFSEYIRLVYYMMLVNVARTYYSLLPNVSATAKAAVFVRNYGPNNVFGFEEQLGGISSLNFDMESMDTTLAGGENKRQRTSEDFGGFDDTQLDGFGKGN